MSSVTLFYEEIYKVKNTAKKVEVRYTTFCIYFYLFRKLLQNRKHNY